MVGDTLIYKFNDMAVLLVRGLEIYSSRDLFPTIRDAGVVEGIDPLGRFIEDLFFKSLQPVLAANFIFLFYFLVSLIVSYILFSALSREKVISLLFSLLYSLSIYFLYRVVSFTPTLYPVFVFPLAIYFLHIKKVSPFLMGLFVSILFAYTSYYAFFTFLLVVLWYISSFVFDKDSLKSRFGNLLRSLFLFALPLALVMVLVFGKLIVRSIPVFSSYRQSDLSENYEHSYRPIEDWYDFSFRPWYFVIPPKASLYFGDLSDEIHGKIKDTGYYLADDYEETEMAGSYMGWHFVLGSVFAGVLAFAGRGGSFLSDNRKLVKKSILVVFVTVLISLPPSFTVSGITFYTPSYLMYYLFPVFRVLVRLSVVIYLLVLIINTLLVLDIYSLMKSRIQKAAFLFVFIFLNYLIFGIKLPFIGLSNPPPEVKFLQDLPSASIAVYPNANHESIFWVLSHKKSLINPMDFVNYNIGFSSNEFSKRLVTYEGIEELKELGGDYLLVYKYRLGRDRMSTIKTINPLIEDYGDLEKFYELNLGEKVYEDERSVIFSL